MSQFSIPHHRHHDVDDHHSLRWWILAVLAVAQLMVVLDSTVVNIALPHAQAQLHFSNSARQWIVTAYSLSFGSLLLLGGRLADVFGRKRLFLIGVAGFAIASAVGGASVNFAMLVTARSVQGAFGAILAPAGLSLLTTTFKDPAERGKAFGIYGGTAAAGASVGLLLGGFLTQYLSWRFTMYVNIFFAVGALVGGWRLLAPLAGEDHEPLDKWGTALACLAMFAIVYGFAHAATAAGSAGWTSGITIGFLAVGMILLAMFIAFERRSAHPLLPMSVILDRNRAASYLAMFLASVGMFGVFLFLTYYLETVLGYSPVKNGLAFLPLTGAIMVSSTLATVVLLPKISPRIMAPIGLLMGAAGMVLFTRIGLHSHYYATILPPLVLVALGLGLVFAPAFSLGTMGVKASDAGVASAMVNVSQQIGGSIGTAMLNSIATSSAATYVAGHLHSVPRDHLTALAAIHSYTLAFWVGAIVFVVAALVVTPLLRPGIVVMEDGHLPGAV